MESTIGKLYHKEQNMIYNALPRTLQPGYHFGPHCHKNVEVCMMTEGECDIVVNGETITVRTGEMMVIFSHMIHSFHMRSRRPARFLPDAFSAGQLFLGGSGRGAGGKVSQLYYR